MRASVTSVSERLTAVAAAPGDRRALRLDASRKARAARARSRVRFARACAPLQDAVAAGLETLDDDYHATLAADYRRRRDVLNAALLDAGFDCSPPAGAYYILASFAGLSDERDDDFARRLAAEAGVATVPGSSFFHDPAPGRDLVRFAFCKKIETLETPAERLRRL